MLAFVDQNDLDSGPRTKSGTERMCAVTRDVRPIDDLIRFVVSPSGEVVPDLKRKLPGRGLWLSCAHGTVKDACRRGVFAKAFKRKVTVSETLASETERLMVHAVMDALAMAAKAGHVVSGFGKVEDALNAGQAIALIHASDGAADGIRKLDAKFAAISRDNNRDSGDLPVVRALTSAQLDLALGRANVVHAALLAGPASKTVLDRCKTLVRFGIAADGNGNKKTDTQLRQED
jgi:predicted RNA-binding protein YlxR (DUF448 family)